MHPPSPPDTISLTVRLTTLHGLADRAEGVVRMAHALVEGGRHIELTGLEQTIGQLCAGCLDVGPEDARGLRQRLEALLAEMDALTDSLHHMAAGRMRLLLQRLLLPWLSPAAGHGGRALQVEQVVALDPRRRLSLIRIGERRVVLLTGGSDDRVIGWLPSAGPAA